MSEHVEGPGDRFSAGAATACVSKAVVHEHPFTREFAKGVHHHLRTPLTVVLGHAELLIDREHECPADVRRSLAALLQAARRLNEAVLGVCDLIDTASADPKMDPSLDISGAGRHRGRRVSGAGDTRGSSVPDLTTDRGDCAADRLRRLGSAS